MPTEALQQKALQYVNKEMISAEMANRVIQAIVQERGHVSILNDDEQHQPVDGEAEAQHAHLTTRFSEEEMKALLGKREAMMREGGRDGTMTDQWRVYQHIIGCIQRGELLRLFVQASAGTGHYLRRRRMLTPYCHLIVIAPQVNRSC